MAEDNDPGACVDDWIESTARGLPVDLLVDVFHQAFDALWQRASLTLGDVTLMAIVDRVLYNAAERFPQLASLKVESAGIRMEALRERAAALSADDLISAIRFALVEFLRVLGNLTADILTQALYAELAKVTVAREESNG